MRTSLDPYAFAASMYSIPFTCRTAERTIREKGATIEIVSATPRLKILDPSADTIVTAISICGIARKTSAIRMITLSTMPPKYAATAPKIEPRIIEISTVETLIATEILAPKMIRANKSRPY